MIGAGLRLGSREPYVEELPLPAIGHRELWYLVGVLHGESAVLLANLAVGVCWDNSGHPGLSFRTPTRLRKSWRTPRYATCVCQQLEDSQESKACWCVQVDDSA